MAPRVGARRRVGCPRTTCRPRSRCSAPCCCRAMPSRPPSEPVTSASTSTSPPTATSTTPSARCTARGEPVDPVTVADELRRAGLLDAIGGPAALLSLQANTPATSNAGRYAQIVEEHALLRRLIGVAGEIAELGYAVPDDVTKALDSAESMVYDLSPAPRSPTPRRRAARPARRDARPPRDALRARRRASPARPPATPTSTSSPPGCSPRR